MEAKLSLLLSFLCFIACLHTSFSASGETNSFESVPDLEKSMYTEIDGFPCVRLLNLSGEIGCSNPGREKVVAPIVRFKNSKELTGPAAVLVSLDEFESVLSRVSKDSDFASKVAGIFVESRSQVQNGLKGFSPDVKFPQAEFAPYTSNNFQWNPAGSGIMWKAYNFPVILLSETSTSILQQAAIASENNKKAYTKVVSEFDLVMQTTKSGTHDSDSCLKEGTCLPLGGYSVWSALPPINLSSPPKAKPVVLVITSMDTASFFRDKSLGAESPISGLIALLAVVDALSNVGLSELNKQLVFLVLTGEAWGYLGSRRFFEEFDQQSDTIKGLNLTTVETVMEIGSVGTNFPQGTKTFFAHTAGATSSVNETLTALYSAQDSLSGNVMVRKASTSNPGVPPSSLMTFLTKKPEISGLVLEDFDSAFSNEFYHSHLDDLSNINSSSIVAAASLVARTLYIQAGGKDPSALDSIKINASLVEELLGCLLDCEPGLSCGLVEHYISPSTTCPSHYVGVILGEPSTARYPIYAGDISRFIWNFLADKTALPSKNASSSCPKHCNGDGEVCIRQEAVEKGVCVISSTRYVPAYSTRLKYDSEGWKVLASNSSDMMGSKDPIWTESNWDVIQVRVYTVQDGAYDRVILLLGIVVTLLAYVLIVVGRTLVRKALKRD
ncbi:nicastrin isoform X2 [Salvia miltiorrhiza]|uniref:nicastrin isoform X2 n=1 Tax=Salvia miltiorrhiza TaxID=226208 RepID=UPI0025ACA473|nr:nicastrin isoform X2 [Salvia miltiorrhiza]